MATSPPGGSSNRGKAFVRGGAGCLLAFLAIGAFFLLIGGEFYLDFGGVIFLIVVGGIIGLIVNAVYQRGRRDAASERSPGPRGPIDPE